jgi:hypothetical protein
VVKQLQEDFEEHKEALLNMTGNYNSNTRPELVDLKHKMDTMEQHFEGLYVQKNELITIDRRFST